MASVRKRKDGRWEGRLRTENGRQLSVYGWTEAEAQAKLQVLEQQCLTGHIPPVGKTVGELLDRWLEFDAHRWKPVTEHEYRRLVEQVIRPALGSVRLGKLDPDRLQQFVNTLADRPTLARNVYRVLHRAFKVGIRWGWASSNPCDRIDPPVYRSPLPELPTGQRLVRFLDDTRDHWLWPWLVVALHTGIRPGEQASLRWTDVNSVTSVIRVARTGQWIQGQWIETEPKTRAGTRMIPVGPAVWDALGRQQMTIDERRQQAGTQWTEMDLVFPSTTGKPLAPNTVRKALHMLCERHGLPKLSPHKLRHCHASLLLEQNVPITQVSRQLGHSNPGITMTIYAHALAVDDRVAQAIGRALGN